MLTINTQEGDEIERERKLVRIYLLIDLFLLIDFIFINLFYF